MINSDDFNRIRKQLGLGRGDQLVEIQSYLDQIYPKRVRAMALNNGVLKLATQSSSVASELRAGQLDLIKKPEFKTVIKLQIVIQADN